MPWLQGICVLFSLLSSRGHCGVWQQHWCVQLCGSPDGHGGMWLQDPPGPPTHWQSGLLLRWPYSGRSRDEGLGQEWHPHSPQLLIGSVEWWTTPWPYHVSILHYWWTSPPTEVCGKFFYSYRKLDWISCWVVDCKANSLFHGILDQPISLLWFHMKWNAYQGFTEYAVI